MLVLVAILQFELGCRQYWLSKIRSEAFFAIHTSKRDDNAIHVEVRNVGFAPAYLVSVSRIICRGVPLPPKEWSQYVRGLPLECLEPSASDTLAVIDRSFYEEKIVKGGCFLEVSYINTFGEWKSVSVIFTEHTPIIVAGREKPPGFLLSIGDYIAMLKDLIALHRLEQRKQRE